MKKASLLCSILLFITVAISAQNAKPKLVADDLSMCGKEWKLISIEEWGIIVTPPGEKNKNDMLSLTEDGKFKLIMFGIEKSGSWTKSGKSIYFTDETSKTKFNYKILSLTPNNLKVDHYTEEDGHSVFEFGVK